MQVLHFGIVSEEEKNSFFLKHVNHERTTSRTCLRWTNNEREVIQMHIILKCLLQCDRFRFWQLH